jgi:hypothetical protein
LGRSLRRAASALRRPEAANGKDGIEDAPPGPGPSPERLPRRARLREGILRFTVDGRTLLYQPEQDHTVVVRQRAGRLAALDGGAPLGELVGGAARESASPEREIVADMVATLLDLERAGMLVALG